MLHIPLICSGRRYGSQYKANTASEGGRDGWGPGRRGRPSTSAKRHRGEPKPGDIRDTHNGTRALFERYTAAFSFALSVHPPVPQVPIQSYRTADAHSLTRVLQESVQSCVILLVCLLITTKVA